MADIGESQHVTVDTSKSQLKSNEHIVTLHHTLFGKAMQEPILIEPHKLSRHCPVSEERAQDCNRHRDDTDYPLAK